MKSSTEVAGYANYSLVLGCAHSIVGKAKPKKDNPFTICTKKGECCACKVFDAAKIDSDSC